MNPDTQPFAFGRDGVRVFSLIGAALAAWFWYEQ